MSDITISYKGSSIATMDATGTKTLLTEGKYCEDDIEVAYVKPSGGGEEDIPNLKDVIFIDYDGTVVQNYTKAEFLALEAMPANPSHAGLTAQGWNWNLTDAKDYVRENGIHCIGQNYVTTDGKTKVYITITDGLVGRALDIGVTATVKNGVTIDWGDGSTTVTTANANTFGFNEHSYSEVGDYVINIYATDGTYQLGGSSSFDGFINSAANKVWTTTYCVTKVEIGANVTQIHRNAFNGVRTLKTISIPLNVVSYNSGTNGGAFGATNIECLILPSGTNAFSGFLADYCSQLRFISLPKSCTGYSLSNGNLYGLLFGALPSVSSLPDRVFYNSYVMQKGCIPGTYTSLTSNKFRDCRSIRSITVPESVTSIAQFSIFPCINIREYHFKSTTPPSLAASSNILTVGTGVVIYVPYSVDHSVLEDYKTATNWTSFASYIQEEPQ